MFRKLMIAIMAIAFLGKAVSAQTYNWNSVKMGGGGFVSAIITSKQEPSLIYARTDVGGAYKWNSASSSWTPLLDWASSSQTGFLGVESLAIDPQSTSTVYMLVGISYFNSGKTAILKSTDYGQTFTTTEVTSQFTAHGNGMGRQNGERLQVDPNNSSVLYCGTRSNGLFKSTNGGATWTNLSGLSVTTTPNGNGICFVVIDPNSKGAFTESQKLYVGVSRSGTTNLYVSTDAGATFSAVPGAITTYMPQRAVLASTGFLYVTYGNGAGPHGTTTPNEPADNGAVYKYNTSTNAWTNITPAGYARAFSGISVNPLNPQSIVLSTINTYWLQYGSAYGDRILKSIDGGTSWSDRTNGNINLDANGVNWVSGIAMHWVGSVEFDQADTSKVWATSGHGIFSCSNINASPTTWRFNVAGVEETVPLGIVSIPGGPLFSAIGDYDGFKHSDVSVYSSRHSPADGSNYSIAYAANNTSYLARVTYNSIYYSTNQGTSWTQCATRNGTAGKIAVSANGSILLHAPTGTTPIYRSVNNGTNWTAATGLNFSNPFPVADMVNSNKFYALNRETGDFYVSTDGGQTFSVTTNVGGWAGMPVIRTAPGSEGHVWMAARWNGLQRSTNSGTSFSAVSGVSWCDAIGFGKAATGGTYSAIYIWGIVGGVEGIFRSTNEGSSWVRINDDAHEYGGIGNAETVMGDMNIYGRVYLSTAGRGIAYADEVIILPIKLTFFNAQLAHRNNCGNADLVWGSDNETNAAYFDVERSLDGRQWTKVAQVASKAVNGNSNLPLSYSYLDNINELSGTIYYRLKQVDLDGHFIYSTVVTVRKNAEGNEAVFAVPNPSANNLNIHIQLQSQQNVSIRIVHLNGSVIQRMQMKLSAGINRVPIPGFINYAAGIYHVLVYTADDRLIGTCSVLKN